MSVNPKVSILIPVYNGSNFIKDSIESALNQTYKNIEILVINDGSNDNDKTENIVKSFGDKVRYIKKENGGVASALNLGIKEATGEYISWLSHDDAYMPNKIEKEIEVLEKLENKETIIFSNFELMDEFGITFNKTDYAKNMNVEKFCQGIYPVLMGTVNGCTTLISKKCFDGVGLFREDLRTTNDYEMWIRLFSKYSSYFIKDYLVKYRIHKNQDTNSNPLSIIESNDLWTDIVNNLDEDEIKKWGFDVFNIYMTIYRQTKGSKFYEAAKVAYKKAEDHYKKIIPNVTIAMPCYNSAKYLKTAIDSILEQTYSNFELLIVDDSSTDDTLNIAETYAKEDFRIKILKNQYEKGVSGGMNTALNNARGKYFTRMDSDDISVLDRIERQVDFLDQNTDYGICSVNIAMINELGIVYSENPYPLLNVPNEWTFLWTNPLPNPPCIYRSEIIKKNNIKFNNLKTAEDYDFLGQLVLLAKSYMINEPLYFYRFSTNSLYNKNKSETFNNSLEISKKFYEKVTNQKTPEYYKFLTYFYNEKDEPIQEDIVKVYEFLEETAEYFKKYFKWTEEEYKNVRLDLIRIIERYSIYKNSSKLLQKEPIEKKPSNSRIINLLRKTKNYYKTHGIRMTIKKILSKIKRKIWKRK